MDPKQTGPHPPAPVLTESNEAEEFEEPADPDELDELEALDALEDEPEELDALEEEQEEAEPGIVSVSQVASVDSEEKVRLMVQAADAVRAEDIVVLDLRELTIIADFFLISTGKSSIQIRAIADRIEEKLRDYGFRKLRIEGYQEATWILLDYGDVVCHVMAAEQRAFYNLEGFWHNAPHLELELTPEPALLKTPSTTFESLNPLEEIEEIEELEELEELE